jgi:hypothetical protein
MKPKILLLLVLVLVGVWFGCSTTPNRPRAAGPPDQSFQSLMKLFDQKYPDYVAMIGLYKKQLGTLTLAQRNAFALQVAKSLVTTNETQQTNSTGHPGGQIDTDAVFLLHMVDEFRSPHDMPEIISSEDCSITTPEIIPYLIEALDAQETDVGGEHGFGGDHAQIIGILGRFTEHHAYFSYAGGKFSESNHKAVVDWWRDWWRDNKDKHPMFDSDLVKLISGEYAKVERTIKEVAPVNWDGNNFYELEHPVSAGDYLDPMGPSANWIWYARSPGGGLLNLYRVTAGDDIICISWDFLDRDLASGTNDAYKFMGRLRFSGDGGFLYHDPRTWDFQTNQLPSATHEAGKEVHQLRFSGGEVWENDPLQEIFHDPIAGTGIEVKLAIGTTNIDLIKALKAQLSQK